MKNPLNCCSGRCGKALGGIRIIAGLVLIIFGIEKFGGGSEGMAELGSAATDLLPFLSFLPDVARGWIATFSEIISGIMLLSGCRLLVRYGALIALSIMIFAGSAQGIIPPLVIVTLGSLAVLIRGPGCRKFCPAGCPCNKKACAGGMCSTGIACACGSTDGSCACDTGSCPSKSGSCGCKGGTCECKDGACDMQKK